MTDALDRVRERARARKRREAAKERGRKLIEAARARARKMVEAARARARAWLDVASRPRVRLVVKEAKPKTKRRTKATSAKPKGKPRPMAETRFANQVLRVVRSMRPRKFGDKAYIASVWQVGFAADMTLGDFKKRIVAEHQAGRLELSRADLVAAMDQVLVERSETQHLNATFHFIRPEVSAKPARPKTMNTIEQAATFRRALGAVSAENPPGALLSVREVRERAGLPKAVFDALALSFASKNLIVLHHHDFPTSLAAAERAQMVEDGKGTFYVGIALRRPEPTPVDPIEPASKLLTKAKLYGAGAPVRIASLRKDVSMSPEQFDLAIERLQRLGKVALYRDDNRVTARDEGAYFAAGEPRHILYVKG